MSPRTGGIVIGLVVVALLLGAYWFFSQPRGAEKALVTEPALAWLPAEARVVAAVHVTELRQQVWLPELLRAATPVEEEAEYRQFVAATGFDYTRDLDHVWLALLPGRSEGEVAGVAEGRFDREKILGYARSQGARQVLLGGVSAYVIEQADPKLRFAFLPLDKKRVAFAETRSGLEKILACLRDAAPAVADDAARRARLERFAAGLHAWSMTEDVAAWRLPGLENQSEVTSKLRRLAVGGRVTGEGIDVIAEAETHEPSQAERLKRLLQTYGLAGRTLLSLKDDATSLALREILGSAALEQRESQLELRLKASRAALAALLKAQGRTPRPVATEKQ